MKWSTDMRVKMRIIAAFIMAAAVAGGIGFVGIRNMYKVNIMAGRMHEKELLGVSYVREAQNRLICMARAEQNAILASTQEDRQKYVMQARINEVLSLKGLQKARPLFPTRESKDLLDNVDGLWAEYVSVHNQVLDLVIRENPPEERPSSELALGLAWNKLSALETALNALAKTGEDNTEDQAAQATRIFESSRTYILTLCVACVLFGIGLGAILALSITRTANRMTGDLTVGAAQTPASSGKAGFTSGKPEEDLPANCRTDSTMGISGSGMETIVKAIDGIALQANLLALNAAVESARTGLTSVADEVMHARAHREESFMGQLSADFEAKTAKQRGKTERDGDG